MRRTPKHLVAVAVAATIGLAVVACGSDEPSATAAKSTTTPGTGTVSTVAGGNSPGSTVTTPSGDVVHPTNPSGDFPPVNEPARDGSLSSVKVTTAKVADLDAPIVLVPRPGTKQLYVAERAGTVRILTVTGSATTVDEQPALDISADTSLEGERGLLGLAFSKDGTHLYVSHTNKAGDSRVEQYTMKGDVADPSTKVELLAQKQPFPNHNGGNIVLGPDGLLWFGLGDGGSTEDPYNNAQNPKTYLGKMLRIDPSKPGTADIWADGLRNPWRFSFDAKTKDLWIGDVGQDHWEEIDWVPADAGPGLNFGWSGYEASKQFKVPRVPNASVPPVFETSHDDGWCSITGGVVYRGTEIPALDGVYLFADYCKAGLFGLRLADGAVTDERPLGPDLEGIASINTDLAGEVYLLSQKGGVYRLDAG